MNVTRVRPGVVRVERTPLTVLDRLYLPQVIAGMMVTIGHLMKNLFNMKKLPTISYPEVKRVYSERFRGRHILTTRDDGTTRCVACYMCSTACPAECITIEAGEDERTREKFPVRYDIDLLRCIFCGYCVDACPEDAIYMTRDYEMAIDTRARSVVGLRDLVVPPNFPVGPMRRLVQKDRWLPKVCETTRTPPSRLKQGGHYGRQPAPKIQSRRSQAAH